MRPLGPSTPGPFSRRTFIRRLAGGTGILSIERAARLVSGAALGAAGVVRLSAQAPNLPPLEDATIHQASPGDGNGSSGNLTIGEASGLRIDAALRFDDLDAFVDTHGTTNDFTLRLTLAGNAPATFGPLVAYATTETTDASDTTPVWGETDAGCGSATSPSLDNLSSGQTLDIDVTSLVTAMRNATPLRQTIRLRRQALAGDAAVSCVETGGAGQPVLVATPRASATATPSPTASPTPSASPSPTSTPTPSASATPIPTPTRTPQSTSTPTPTPQGTPAPTPTPTPLPPTTPVPTPSASGLPPVVLELIQQINGTEQSADPHVTLLIRTAIDSFTRARTGQALRVLLTAITNLLTGARTSLEVDAPLNQGGDAARLVADTGMVECIVELAAPPGTYFVRAQAITPFGLGPPSAEISFVLGNAPCTAEPPAPPVLAEPTVDGTSVTLAWTEVPTSTSYVLEVGSAPGLADLARSNVGPVTRLSSRSAPGTYYVRVRGSNVCGLGEPSNEVTVRLTSALEVPGMPRDLQADVRGGVVRVTWAPPLSGGPVTSYVLQAGTAPGGIDAGQQALTGTALVVPDVPPGAYYVRVYAQNEAGTGPATPDLAVAVA
ncbi:MAG: fibronectin type III domain-containing protein [Vicinamibacterales bacterium]